MEMVIALQQHLDALRACRQCPSMQSAPVTGQAVYSKVMLVGQAPGNKEPVLCTCSHETLLVKSPLHKAPHEVTRDGMPVGQSVPASVGARSQASPEARQ
jgi:hypothetical protein